MCSGCVRKVDLKVPFLHGFYKELVYGMEFHVSISKFCGCLVGQDLHWRKIYGGVYTPFLRTFISDYILQDTKKTVSVEGLSLLDEWNVVCVDPQRGVYTPS